jgi:hypothetical protein
MKDPQYTRAAVELSPREKALLAKSSPSRGYAPQGEDVEPDHAPAGAASASFPASGDGQSADRGQEFQS